MGAPPHWRHNESAGKGYSGRTRKGNPAWRVALMEAVQAAAPTKQTYLSAQYHRLAARRDKKKAAVAMGHTILVIAHHLLSIDESVYGTGALTTSMNATASP